MLPAPTASRLPTVCASLSLFAAVAWLVFRVRCGLDFSDEMQYYGEIASLTRTGRFFQDDLFLQQLGYVFLLPFFKLHAFFFPDRDYLVLFSRLLLLAAYTATGVLFWRTATRLAGFSRAQKLTGLAVFLSCMPFQIFAFSYNSTSYLLVIALVSVWLTRAPGKFPRYAATVAGLLTVLTYTHPTVGLALILTAAIEVAGRISTRAAFALLGATAAAGLAVLGVIVALHGASFPADLLDAINFSRAFGVGAMILTPWHFAGWLTLLALGGLFIWRTRRGRAFPYPCGPDSPLAVRWIALAGCVLGLGVMLALAMNWKGLYLAVCGCLALLLVLAACLPPADGQRPVFRFGNTALLRWTILLTLGGGLLALGAIVSTVTYSPPSYFTITVFVVLLIILAGTAGTADAKTLTGLAVIGTVAGAVFAFTSGNGLPSFGVGAAGIMPFLALYAARSIPEAGSASLAILLPGLSLLLLFNGVQHPYREQPCWAPFEPIVGVPAFRGILTSPVKVRAVEIFQHASPRGALTGKRVLIIGPQPWLYFVLGGIPATPILFMKFDGNPAAYELAAQRLFRNGQPDVMVLTTTSLSAPIGQQLQEWDKQPNQVKTIALAPDFARDFEKLTQCALAPEVYLFTRLPAQHP